MLLHVDGEIVEIRPGELFESKSYLDSRYLERIDKKKITIKKRGRPKNKPYITTFEDKLNGNSSSTQS